jgi:hypothetical protein
MLWLMLACCVIADCAKRSSCHHRHFTAMLLLSFRIGLTEFDKLRVWISGYFYPSRGFLFHELHIDSNWLSPLRLRSWLPAC